MLQAALAQRHRRSGARSSSSSPGGCPRAGATAWSRASGGPSTRSRTSASTTRRWPCCARAGSSTSATLEWLADYRFSGDIWGYAEGEVYFPYSPLVIVESTFAEAVLLETLLLSIYNHDSAIASAASRMTQAAGDRPCIEMGSRRTHEEAAVACARAAYVAGFATHLQPRGPAALRRADRRHVGPLVHAAARHRGRRVPGAGDLARRRHHAAGRHLRRGRGGPARGRGRRAGASAPSGSTPATSARWPGRCATSSTRWAPRAPGSW